MILGLPWTAWLLLFIATLPAPIAALIFFRFHRDDHGTPVAEVSSEAGSHG